MLRSLTLRFTIGGLLLCSGQVQAQVGPDTYGHYAYSSSHLGGPVYQWIEIGSSGTLVATGDDSSSTNSALNAPVTLGAPFSFYGAVYTALVPTTNGYISTDPADTGPDLSNDCPLPRVPSTGSGARIYPLHDDLVADVYYLYFASSPVLHWSGQQMGVSVFQWNAEHFPSGGGSFAFEALLFDNGDILFQYAAGNPEFGSGSTTGVQDISASIGLAYACNEPLSIPEQFAVLITRTPPPVDGNAQFAVTKGKFNINWAAHELESPEDALDLQVLFNPAGIVPDITGATLRIAIRGTEVLPATSLDERGSASSERGAYPSFSARVDAKGKLKAKFTGLDLRASTGLFNQDGTGLIDLPMVITITGAGLLQEELNAIATFGYATQLDRATKATTALNKAGNLTPVFIPLKVKITEVPGAGHVVQVSKAILQFSASAPALPIDVNGVAAEVRVEVGTAEPIEVPYESLRVRGEGSRSLVTYLAALFDVVGLSRLSVKNSSRSIAFSTGPLADTGLPAVQEEGAPLEHDLQIGLLFHTDIGLVRAYSTVRVTRKSALSGSWSN